MTRAIAFLGLFAEIGRLNQWSSDAPYVLLPLCHKHRWFRYGWPYTAQIILFLLAFVVLVMLPVVSLTFGVQTMMIFTLGFEVVHLCLVGWFLMRALRIRALRVGEKNVVLTGVAPAFVRACEEMHQREASEFMDALAGDG